MGVWGGGWILHISGGTLPESSQTCSSSLLRLVLFHAVLRNFFDPAMFPQKWEVKAGSVLN